MGVSFDVARRLVQEYPLTRVGEQVDWLPYRGAKNPARFIVAAIEKEYDPPPNFSRDASLNERQQNIATTNSNE